MAPAIDTITSAVNPKIKDLLMLQEKSKYRKERGVFVVEGKREIRHCIEGKYYPEEVFFCPDYISAEELAGIFNSINIRAFSVSKYVYEKIACRGTTEGLIAVMQSRERTLGGIILGKNPVVVVLESVEKPGNLGAVLRTTDAAGIDALLICDPLTDLYNPNLIRASIGGVFTQQVAACSSEDAIRWLKANNFKILTAQLQDSVPYYSEDLCGAVAIVLGSESDGLSDKWRKASDAKINIPMLGKLDSLNVSISAAILCYEVVRQRQSNTI